MPPVAMKWMPAMRHTASVPATVVAPRRSEITPAARSRGPILRTCPSPASRSSSARPIPTRTVPSITAMVAGTAPLSRTACSLCSATSTPSGSGSP